MSMAPLKKSVAQQMSEALLISVVYYNKGFVRCHRVPHTYESLTGARAVLLMRYPPAPGTPG